MALDSPWAEDFCLTCDKQIHEGPYCSQTCRSADLDRASALSTAAPSPDYGAWTLPLWHASVQQHQLPSRSDSASRTSSNRASMASLDSLLADSSITTAPTSPHFERRQSAEPGLPHHIMDQLKDYDNCIASSRSARRWHQARVQR